jgi:hypothetical protein
MNNLETMCFLGRCLAPAQDEVSGELRRQICSGAVDWKHLMLIASGHYLSPGLCAALKRRGLWELAPAEIRDILQATDVLNRERNALHYEQLIAVTHRLNAAGIEPLLLKGAICLLPGQLPEIPERVLSDLDLVVPEDRAGEALRSIEDIGYVYHPDMDREQFKRHHHLPPLYHPTQGIRIEIHRDVVDARLKPILSAEMMWRTARPVEFGAARGFVPDHYMRMLHNVVHARLDDRHHQDFKLEMRQLNEWVQLRDHYESGIDWLQLWQHFDRHGEAAVLEAYFLAAERFFGQPLPPGIKPSRAAVRAERIMCLALRGPVSSFLLSTVKSKLRHALNPTAYKQKYREIRRARLEKKQSE